MSSEGEHKSTINNLVKDTPINQKDSNDDLEPLHARNSMFITEVADSDETLPVIDIAHWEENQDIIAKQVNQACSTYGFMFIKNAPIDWDTCHQVFEQSRVFFDLPTEQKQQIAGASYIPISKVTAFNVQRGRDYKERIQLNLNKPLLLSDLCPSSLRDYAGLSSELLAQAQNTAYILLQIYALALGLPKDWLLNKHNTENRNAMSVLHYPPNETLVPLNDLTHPDHNKNNIQMRVGEHSDFGTISLLFMSRDDCGGLQVLSPLSSKWMNVGYKEKCILVNTGDLLMYWTNGKYMSTVHRVVVSQESRLHHRYSMPYFVMPASNTPVQPLVNTSQTTQHDTQEDKIHNQPIITAGEYIARRILATSTPK